MARVNHAAMSGVEYWGKVATVTGVILFVALAAVGGQVHSVNGAAEAAAVTVAVLVLFVAIPAWVVGRLRRGR